MPRDASKIQPLKTLNRTTRKAPGAAKRTVDQREADFAFIASKLIRGSSHREIAGELSKARSYGITRKTVSEDVIVVIERWRTACLDDIEAQKAEHLAKLAELERKCWQRIEALENGTAQEFGSKTVYKPKTRTSTRAARTKQTKDTTGYWLTMLQFCLKERAKILGFYAPLKLDAKGGPFAGGGGTTNNFLAVNVTIATDKPVSELTAAEIVDEETAGHVDPEDAEG